MYELTYCAENLREHTDSMLFDSNTTVACLSGKKNGMKLSLDLMVRGSVFIRYKGNAYTMPSKFPADLRELISKGILEDYDEDEDEPIVYCSENNWYECLYELKSPDGETHSDGIMFEDAPANYTEDELLKVLSDKAEEIFSNAV